MFKLLPHLPYSPDVASMDYFLFPNMEICGKKIGSNHEVIAERSTYFVGFGSYFNGY